MFLELEKRLLISMIQEFRVGKDLIYFLKWFDSP